MRIMRRFVLAVLVVSCGGDSERSEDVRDGEVDTATAQPGEEPSDDLRDTTLRQDEAGSIGISTPMLTAVRAAVHEKADRIVFEFDAPLPGYKLEYIDRPVRQCGSGDMVELPGDAWLSIRFFPANAHTEEGRPTVANRDQSFTDRNLKQLKLICDFEAVVEWVAAVGSPLQYKVLELKAPDRLVIDVGNGQ